ncbi:pentapeptide repeat-containing protein [Nocardia sp. NPDC056100]|uniref:pentapeptide repeat-containing protein n=1 Tax=Nocardia sp. NPDC056100 TaxID=3345712 RepID=UPI0035DD0D6A
MRSATGGTGARRRPNRIHSLRQPDTRRFRVRRASRALFGWGGWPKLAAMVTTIAALATLWFTNQSLRATSEQSGLARQTAVTDRFAKAVEQLGNSSLDIRLGGINLLRKLAEDSEPDRVPITQMLAAFVRTHAPNGPECGVGERKPEIDIQTALTVVGSRDETRGERIDLSNTCLAWVDLDGAHLRNVYLHRSNLVNASLDEADLRDATFFDSTLDGVHAYDADLRGAGFQGVSMRDAGLFGAKLQNAMFSAVDLRKATFGRAELQGAIFGRVDLRGASLGDGFTMSLSDTPPPDLMTVAEERLAGARFMAVRFDADTVWPNDFAPRSKPYQA